MNTANARITTHHSATRKGLVRIDYERHDPLHEVAVSRVTAGGSPGRYGGPMSTFEVSFPGGVRVDATYRGHVVHTDQPSPLGTNTAMSPFDLFLASIATCM